MASPPPFYLHRLPRPPHAMTGGLVMDVTAFVHQRSLDKASPEQRAEARIPIEKSKAHFLLLADTKDVVWPSAPMTKDIQATLRAAHMESVAKADIFQDASHYICGTGSEPRRVNPVHRPEGDDPTPEADAHASAESWKETKAFLQKR